jgi:cob(I)alamin adenosyltransferase
MNKNDCGSSDEHQSQMKEIKKKMREEQKKKTEKRGVLIVITGNGKGKSTSGFGTLLRALGHGHKVGVIQFIKGKWKTGESKFIEKSLDDIEYHCMETGFTWDTQNRESDIYAAESTWAHAEQALNNPEIKLVLIDELTYMLNYNYLDASKVINALQNRPINQTVIVTGRDACERLIDLADTVSHVQEIKHAYNEGIRAQKGVDF